MSVETELNRIISAKADIRSAIMAKGVTVPVGLSLSGYSALIAQISGGAAVTSEPAAFAVGGWTLTAGTEQATLNITALPSDGGSAITALQYRIGAAAAVAVAGTGTGVRTITGLTAGIAINVQVRAVNAVGAGAWSDTKSVTPSAASSGTATWAAVSTTTGGIGPYSATTPTKPANTAASDLLVMVISSVSATAIADLAVPAGWTQRAAAYSTMQGLGIAIFTASGDVQDAVWKTANTYTDGYFDMHRVTGANLATPIREILTREAQSGFDESLADMPTPSATAVAGDCVLSVYFQPQSTTAVGTPTAGYTRVLNSIDPNRRSVVVRSGAPSGLTGEISHAAAVAWEARSGATIVIAAA